MSIFFVFDCAVQTILDQEYGYRHKNRQDEKKCSRLSNIKGIYFKATNVCMWCRNGGVCKSRHVLRAKEIPYCFQVSNKTKCFDKQKLNFLRDIIFEQPLLKNIRSENSCNVEQRKYVDASNFLCRARKFMFFDSKLLFVYIKNVLFQELTNLEYFNSVYTGFS